MFSVILSISSLLFGFCVVLIGVSLLATSLGVRASIEQFSDSITGLIMAGYFMGFIVGSFACPHIIRRIGHIRSFTVFAATAAAAAYSHDIFVDPLAWFALRLVTGIAIVGLYIVIESWINATIPNAQRGRIFAIYMTLTLLAVSAGPYLILVKQGFSFGIAAILFSLGLLPIALTRVVEPIRVTHAHFNIKQLYRTSPLGLAGATLAGLVNGAFFAMGAVFAHKIGMPPPQIALFMSLLVLGGALLQWPLGRLSDRHDRRAVLIAVAFTAALLAGIAYALVDRSHTLMLISIFAYGGMTFAVYPLSVAHVNDRVTNGEVLEATQGILLVYGIGAIAGPIIAGVSMEAFGPRSLLLFFAVSYVLMGVYAVYRKGASAAVSEAEKTGFVPMSRSSQAALEMHPEVGEKP
jgi:MFS family permease